MQNKDLTGWLAENKIEKNLSDIIENIAFSAVKIAEIVRQAPLRELTGYSDSQNKHGEKQKKLDIISNDIIVEQLSKLNSIAAMVSEEMDEIIQNPHLQEADLVVCFDPLDGSSNIDVNATIGTIFSILQLNETDLHIKESQILKASKNQRAAGFILYGPACLFVLTVGKNVALFAFDEMSQQFLLVRNNIKIPEQSNEFAINMSYQQFWDEAIKTYIADCLAGENGIRKKRFNMRWAGSMVADVYRIFMNGGIFIYPALKKPGSENGKLRFLYEANPMAMLVENAGGKAISSKIAIKDVVATNLHQLVPVILGSKEEVEILAKLYNRAN